MTEPISELIKAGSNLAKTTMSGIIKLIDISTGFRLTQWQAEQETVKKAVHDEYEKLKNNGITGMQYIESVRRATNLINTTIKAAKFVDPNKPNEIKADNDFFWNTVEHAKTVSNDEMQTLIAKILAGEYNNPDTYHMSTLQTLKSLGQKELALFEKSCSFIISLDDSEPLGIPCEVFNLKSRFKEVLLKEKFDFGNFSILQSLGLFLPNPMGFSYPGIKHPHKRFESLKIKYLKEEIPFESDDNISVNEVTLTPTYRLSLAGKEILQHLNPQFNSAYYDWLMKNYRVPGFNIPGRLIPVYIPS